MATLLLIATLGLLPAVQAAHHQANPQPAEQHTQSSDHSQAGSSEQMVLLVLAQMQGHLRVAEELLMLGQFSAAEPHVGHPVDELYGAIAPALASHQVEPFLNQLEELRQQVRLNPQSTTTQEKLQQAQRVIRNAWASVIKASESSTATTATVVRRLAENAAAEYSASVAGDRIVETIEYQDARGFLLEANQLTEGLLTESNTNQPHLTTLRTTLAAMLQGVPNVTPPTRATRTAEQMQALANTL